MHLCAIGPGAGLLGPVSHPLTLLGRIRIKGRIRDERPVSAAQSVAASSLRPPGGSRRGRAAHSSFALVRGGGGHGGALEPASAGWEPPAGTPGIWIPRRGSRPHVWQTATLLSSRV